MTATLKSNVRKKRGSMTHRDIATSVAPILNHLLTTPPFTEPSGCDFGWFCREHAIAGKLIFHTNGIDCEIVRGHVAAYISGKKRLTTVGSGADHYWCVTEELCPCDLSMTFRHFQGYPNLIAPISGCEGNEPFVVVYAKDAEDFPERLPPSFNAIYFAPVETLPFTFRECVTNPALILGESVTCAITLASAAYIVEVANTRRHLFQGGDTQHEAVMKVLSHFQNPEKTLLKYADPYDGTDSR